MSLCIHALAHTVLIIDLFITCSAITCLGSWHNGQKSCSYQFRTSNFKMQGANSRSKQIQKLKKWNQCDFVWDLLNGSESQIRIDLDTIQIVTGIQRELARSFSAIGPTVNWEKKKTKPMWTIRDQRWNWNSQITPTPYSDPSAHSIPFEMYPLSFREHLQWKYCIRFPFQWNEQHKIDRNKYCQERWIDHLKNECCLTVSLYSWKKIYI